MTINYLLEVLMVIDDDQEQIQGTSFSEMFQSIAKDQNWGI